MRLNPVMNSHTSHKTYTFNQNNINCTLTENDIIYIKSALDHVGNNDFLHFKNHGREKSYVLILTVIHVLMKLWFR